VDKRNSGVATAVTAAGVEPDIKILDTDAKTAVAAAQQLGCEVGAIANSLVFDCDGEPLLVMASGADRVDTELLARGWVPPRSTRPTRSSCAARPVT
jgi:prolyl-tRNA editing enzyme YbaK/EbsC (Cys-tRNA(Pro) deacylase)